MDQWLLYTIVAIVGVGVFNILVKEFLLRADAVESAIVPVFYSVALFTLVLFALSFYLKWDLNPSRIRPDVLMLTVVLAALLIVNAASIAVAIRLHSVSVVAALVNLNVIVTWGISIYIYGDKITAEKVFGLFAMIVGSYLILK